MTTPPPNTVSDHDPDEQRKGISVSLSMAPIEWEGVKINVLDAPGYADFIGDLRSAIRAVDAVIVVVSAVDGVEVQTEAAWELAVEAGGITCMFEVIVANEHEPCHTIHRIVGSSDPSTRV